MSSSMRTVRYLITEVHDAQPAFDFADDVAVGLDREQHVEALAELIDDVGKSSLAHLFDLVDLAAARGDYAFDLAIDLVDLFFSRSSG